MALFWVSVVAAWRGGGLGDGRGMQAIWSTFHQQHNKLALRGVHERVRAHYPHFRCNVSLRLGELEVLAWLISPFISLLGMFEPAGQGLNSACFGGNSRLAKGARTCTCVYLSPVAISLRKGLLDLLTLISFKVNNRRVLTPTQLL